MHFSGLDVAPDHRTGPHENECQQERNDIGGCRTEQDVEGQAQDRQETRPRSVASTRADCLTAMDSFRASAALRTSAARNGTPESGSLTRTKAETVATRPESV